MFVSSFLCPVFSSFSNYSYRLRTRVCCFIQETSKSIKLKARKMSKMKLLPWLRNVVRAIMKRCCKFLRSHDGGNIFYDRLMYLLNACNNCNTSQQNVNAKRIFMWITSYEE